MRNDFLCNAQFTSRIGRKGKGKMEWKWRGIEINVIFTPFPVFRRAKQRTGKGKGRWMRKVKAMKIKVGHIKGKG